ncbi:tetraacyldisaccharide 4'-kinase [Megasphaera sp. DISK 18]|uniref:tetraacyldisaccharide 4'-kinase n=1 Tax=Megasphaera sp. DISK 18 TaxID=1776081 RepID=UPI000806F9DD|nr:tetraacyldisaccharide 4'-kinase [Megasphaera sp. DISK 18]OBZ34160.1 tetraacyldisaccharide 4'-kinase [Megasphaera sp. DISK 18]
MSLRTAGTAYFHYLTGSKEHHWWDWPALLLLSGASWIYRKAVIMKYRSFADHEERQERLPAVVISLGNITVGGTGKTPMACMLAKELSARGWRVALLNRGYHSKREKSGASVMSDGRMVLLTAEEGGDEASLMARSLMGIPVLVGRDRAVSGRMAVEKFDAQILILDDGFQHWQLYRDVDIVLIDGTNPFGNGHVLPRGILREPLEHLSRADVFIITKVDQVSPETVTQIQEDLRRYNSSAPVALSVHKPSAVLPFLNWDQGLHPEEAMPADLMAQPVLAVSALGNPASFEETLRGAGFTVSGVLRFEDHHHYGPSDIRRMADMAAEKQCILVTTEKDAVKLPADLVKEYDLPLYVLAITLDIVEGQEKIDAVLQSVLEDKL